MAAAEAVAARPVLAQGSGAQREHRSIGRRLLAAFDALDRYPAFVHAHSEVAEARSGYSLGADLIAAVESDVALTVAVLRRANAVTGLKGNVAGVPDALEQIGSDGLDDIITGAETFTLFERTGSWGSAPHAYRIHAVATQRAAARIAAEISYTRLDELFVAALLHDIGKLVLAHAQPRYANVDIVTDLSPDRRIELERRELGVDHAVVGGVLARRWGFPRELAQAIERHHHPAETALAGIVRLGDMVARFEAGNPVSSKSMRAAAANVGLSSTRLELLLSTAPTRERRSRPPSPLTRSEQRIIAELAKGRVYKEIAGAFGLSVSTVRTHLYNAYKKLGVSDRAQAALLAQENGWI